MIVCISYSVTCTGILGIVKLCFWWQMVRHNKDLEKPFMIKFTIFEGINTIIATGFLIAKMVLFTSCLHMLQAYDESLQQIHGLSCTDSMADSMFNEFGDQLLSAVDTNKAGRDMAIISIVLRGFQFVTMATLIFSKAKPPPSNNE